MGSTEIILADEDFDLIGHEDEPGGAAAVILGTITMNGVHFHVQGFQVAGGRPLQRCDGFDGVHAALEGGGDPWQTVEIGGRSYVLLVTPFVD